MKTVHVPASVWTPRNCIGARVYDIDNLAEIRHVTEVDAEAGTVTVLRQPARLDQSGTAPQKHVLHYASIHPIYGGSKRPVLFHCYGRQQTPEPQPEPRWLGDLQRLQPLPGDVFIVSTDERLTMERARNLRDTVRHALRGAEVLILAGGLRLGCMAAPAAALAAPVEVRADQGEGGSQSLAETDRKPTGSSDFCARSVQGRGGYPSEVR